MYNKEFLDLILSNLDNDDSFNPESDAKFNILKNDKLLLSSLYEYPYEIRYPRKNYQNQEKDPYILSIYRTLKDDINTQKYINLQDPPNSIGSQGPVFINYPVMRIGRSSKRSKKISKKKIKRKLKSKKRSIKIHK